MVRRKVLHRPWPVLLLTSWARVEMEEYGGCFLLGGHDLDSISEIESMLSRFWNRHQCVDPSGMPPHPQRTIGFYLHGDEGRGQVKRPLMVISYQMVISALGEMQVNSKQQLGF